MYGQVVDLNIEEILKKISEWDLWSYYIPGVQINKKFLSPLEVETRPSACLFVTHTGHILLKDFRLGTFNIWKFLQYKYKTNFFETLLIVDNDFNLGIGRRKFTKPTMDYFGLVNKAKPNLKKLSTILNRKKREWNKADIEYWSMYGLTTEFLNSRQHSVEPLQNFWVNDKLVYWYTEYNPAYSYEFGNGKRKIYCPFDKNYKFIMSVGEDVLQGEDDLPWIDDTLILTKGYKDVLTLSNLGYNAVAPQSESFCLPESKMNNFFHRFETIFILYDNDSVGKKYSNVMCEKYPNLIPIFIPKDIAKDISDYRKQTNEETTIKLIESWMHLKKRKEL